MKLYGVPASTYCNIVKLALLEKAMPFEEVFLSPMEGPDLLKQISPMGKIPVLVTESGYLSESQAILAYLEQLQPDPALSPIDPVARGRALQIYMFISLYLASPAESLVASVFFGAPKDEALVEQVGEKIERGINALEKVVLFDPFIAGTHLTHADFAAVILLDLVSQVMEHLTGSDPLARIEGLADYREQMRKRPHFSKVLQDRDAMLAAFHGEKVS